MSLLLPGGSLGGRLRLYAVWLFGWGAPLAALCADWMFTDEYPPAQYLSACREWVSLGAQVLGGCCGTTPMHIEALKKGLPRTLPV